MALQLRQALALCWVPQDDFPVIPAARKNLAVVRPGYCLDPTAAPGYCLDPIAAIFSNQGTHVSKGRVRLSPAERGRDATLGKGGSPMWGESLEAFAV